jgi:hypothetical protein
MLRLGTLALAAATAAAAPPSGCAGPPRARVEAARLDGTRPELAILRCRAAGGRAPYTFGWKLGTGVRAYSPLAPLDEEALLVTVDSPRTNSGGVTCTVVDAAGATASAATSLAPLVVTRALVPPKGLIAIDGAGFGGGGAVWLLGAGGARAADQSCKAAGWTDSKIIACRPDEQPVREVRVESGGRLAAAAPVAK